FRAFRDTLYKPGIPSEPSSHARARTPGRDAPSATKPLDSTTLPRFMEIVDPSRIQEPRDGHFVAAKSLPRLLMAIVEPHLVLDCPRAKVACCLFKRAPLLPRRCVDLRTTNSGSNTTVSNFGATFEFSIPSAIRAASCPILR